MTHPNAWLNACLDAGSPPVDSMRPSMRSADDSDRNGNTQGHQTPSPRPGEHSRKRDEHEGTPKRPRIAQACEECRTRKVRCDGVHPVCGPCRRRRKTQRICVYQTDRANPGASSEYVARLEDTIRRLLSSPGDNAELSSRNSGPLIPSGNDQSNVHNMQMSDTALVNTVSQMIPDHTMKETRHGLPLERRDSSIQGGALRREGDLLSPRSSNMYSNECDTSQTAFSGQGECVDGMGNIGESSYGAETSSTASFMKMVKDSVAARLALPGYDSTSLSQSNRAPWKDMNSAQSTLPTAELYMIPPRRTADDMMRVYWNEVHVLYPFLHRPRFIRSYNILWTADGDEVTNRPIYCILNIIFAICCQVTKKISPEEKSAAADIFMRRARQLLQVDLIGGGSLELIQALLLMGQYLQSSEWPHKCWVVIGLAIRVSQGLGLHLPKTTANLKEQQDRELARRLWHGCVFMDRMVSMTLGRPMMISRADALSVPLPASVDDHYLSPEAGPGNFQPPDKPSTVEFYVQSLKLFAITEETLTAMYSSEATYRHAASPCLSPMERLENLDFNTIIKIDSSLRKFNDSLPEYLKVRDNPMEELGQPILSRQANILHLRYLQIQILLYRPILSLLLTPEIRFWILSSPNAQPWLSHAMALPCARNCIQAALEVIDLAYSRQNDNLLNPPSVESLPAWWYEVFFIYTAATALIPARVYSYIRGDVSQSSLSEGWKRSLDVLGALSPLSPSAKRCLAALQLLNEEIAVEESVAADTLHRGNKVGGSYGPTGPTAEPSSPRREARVPVPPVFPLPGLMDPHISGVDTFAVSQQIQDFSWLDSLPVDLIAGDYAELLEFPEG